MARVDVLGFEWDEGNEGHIAHDVCPHDVQQVLANLNVVTNNPRGARERVQHIGQTNGGRELTIVLEPTRDCVIWRPVTAWPSTRAERAIFRRQQPSGGG